MSNQLYHSVKKQRIIKWVLIVLLSLGVLVLVIFLKSQEVQYPLLDKYENIYVGFRGVVSNVDKGRITSRITLANGITFSLDSKTINIQCEPYNLSQFLKVGDSIVKQKDDIYIRIYRDKACYLFKLRETINEFPVDGRYRKRR
ncbi:hypothetical protein [Dysgonomonas sp. BGC7]|uniref:hypothetical protein n=1 Tax=Dysgonomonas sp. BGC7 TaxID=1658008 RepID=UPI000681EA2A|nr:hypothetical protein [Dysgonomonas sp. BGC7]MBD8388226.1 hypothetical protein [Dysgonomonas sp. BGC7]